MLTLVIILTTVLFFVTLVLFLDSLSIYGMVQVRIKLLYPLFVVLFLLSWMVISTTNHVPQTEVLESKIVNVDNIQWCFYNINGSYRNFNCQDKFKRIINEEKENVVVKLNKGEWTYGIYHGAEIEFFIENK